MIFYQKVIDLSNYPSLIFNKLLRFIETYTLRNKTLRKGIKWQWSLVWYINDKDIRENYNRLLFRIYIKGLAWITGFTFMYDHEC